jgi:hypothetical protein
MRIDNQMAGFRSPIHHARSQSKRSIVTLSGVSVKRAINKNGEKKDDASLPGYYGEQPTDSAPYSTLKLKRAVGGLLKQNSI